MTLVTFEHVILHGHMTVFLSQKITVLTFSGKKKYNDAFQGVYFLKRCEKTSS